MRFMLNRWDDEDDQTELVIDLDTTKTNVENRILIALDSPDSLPNEMNEDVDALVNALVEGGVYTTADGDGPADRLELTVKPAPEFDASLAPTNPEPTA